MDKPIIITNFKLKRTPNIYRDMNELDDSEYWWILITICLLIMYLIFSHHIIIFII